MFRLMFSALLVAIALSAPAAGRDGGECGSSEARGLWISPRSPQPGEPLRIMAVSVQAAPAGLTMTNEQGNDVPLESTARGGPPWSLSAITPPIPRGVYRIQADDGCLTVEVGDGRSTPARASGWDLETEAFYSTWIEQLFDAPADEDLNFPSLEPVLRDPARNFLHDHLGLREDRGLPATPDCADLPYFLRAYFAWKMELPIAYRSCSRGSAAAPPRCGTATVRGELARGPAPAAVFKQLSRQLADAVHSGSARTGLRDEASDFYPLELNRESLWPGTVYADPYGHVLVLTRWVPQTSARPGLLMAVDAQPDNSVSRKRFWEGTFLFANPIASAGPGLKAHRPLARVAGGYRPLSNGELLDAANARPLSLDQRDLSPEEFYARMQALINPRGLPPRQAYEATLDALMEQLQTRVLSVDNGEAYARKNPGAVIPMPEGPALFETVGPWEDYSTPSRDMRLLIAMNVLRDLPQRLKKHPELFVLDAMTPDEAAEDLEAYHAARVGERSISYTRSDGSRQELTLAGILARRSALEMAYNPNDCVEVRWGAPPGSAEQATCRRHAPAAQRARMEQYRAWFREARRPPR